MRFFNTAGPVVAEDHYCIPPLERLNLVEVRRLIRDKRYFVLHAPRQTGKTSALLALRDLLNAEGAYRCVYANIEGGQAMREDVEQVMRVILGELALRASLLGDEFLDEIWLDILTKSGPGAALRVALMRWANADPKPLVLLIDEIDALIGDSLLSVLRQLRAGYDQRPEYFPQSIVLCGIRDVRDYRIHSGSANAVITGGSAFNIKSRSLRLGDFSQDEVQTLLAQHTEETGQAFTPDALGRDLASDAGATVAGQRLGRSNLLPRWGRGSKRSRHCYRCRRGERATHPAPRNASRSVGRQTPRRARAAHCRTDLERRR